MEFGFSGNFTTLFLILFVFLIENLVIWFNVVSFFLFLLCLVLFCFVGFFFFFFRGAGGRGGCPGAPRLLPLARLFFGGVANLGALCSLFLSNIFLHNSLCILNDSMFHLIVRGISFLAGLIYRIGTGKHLGVQLISSGKWAVLYLTLVLVIVFFTCGCY